MKIGTKNHCDVEFMFINETNILFRQIACNKEIALFVCLYEICVQASDS